MAMPDYISMVQSYIFWKNPLRLQRLKHDIGFVPTTREEWMKYQAGYCRYCQDTGCFDYEKETIYCICDFLGQLEAYADRAREFESPFKKVTGFDMLDPRQVSDKAGKEDLTKAKRYLESWLENPSEWVFLFGNPGNGKTTLLYALKYFLGRMAFYITLPSFQDLIFRYRTDEDKLGDFMAVVRSSPILLLDDLGLEYGKSEWTISMIANVINFRYSNARYLPVVTTSNFAPDSLVNSPDINLKRIASRLLDGGNSQLLRLRGEDYRIARQLERQGMK